MKKAFAFFSVFLLLGMERLSALGLKDRGVMYMEYSPDGKQIVCANGDGTISIWDMETQSKIKLFASHAGGALSASYSPDGKYILTAGIDGFFRIWDAKTVSVLHSDVYAAFIPAGPPLISYNHRGDRIITPFLTMLRLWDSSGKNIIWDTEIPAPIYSIAISHDDRLIAVGDHDQIVHLIDSGTGKIIRAIDTAKEYLDPVSRLVFSPDGKYLLTAIDYTICLWDIDTGTLIYDLEPPTSFKFIGFSRDGRYITAVSQMGVYRWETGTGSYVHYLQTYPLHNFQEIAAVAISPDETQIAFAYHYDHFPGLLVVDAKTGGRINALYDFNYKRHEFTEADMDRLYPDRINDH